MFRGYQLHLQVRNSYNRSLVSTVGTGIPDPLSMRSKKQLRSVERLVGYPTPLLSLRHLIGSELTQLSVQVRRLLASEHPIVNHSRYFLDNADTTQTHGLLTLLVSKAVNNINPTVPDMDQFGIIPSQRVLAEITEMIHTANTIHSEVIDMQDLGLEGDGKDLEFGNKLVILGGDLLLARACKELAQLYNPQVVGLISQAISDMMTGAYKRPITTQVTHKSHSLNSSILSSCDDRQIRPLVREKHNNICKSQEKSDLVDEPYEYSLDLSYFSSYYHIGSLLSSSCQCCAIMAELDNELQLLVAEFGRHLSIAQQALQDRQELMTWTQTEECTEELHLICCESCQKALDCLDLLPDSESKYVLEDLIVNIKQS